MRTMNQDNQVEDNKVDNELQQVQIKDLNDKQNHTMFTTNVKVRKAFAAKQKNRKLKSRVLKLKPVLDRSKVKRP